MDTVRQINGPVFSALYGGHPVRFTHLVLPTRLMDRWYSIVHNSPEELGMNELVVQAGLGLSKFNIS